MGVRDYRADLIEALRRGAEDLARQAQCAEQKKADATAVRQVQLAAQTASVEANPVAPQAYLLDLLIEDVFYNVFGDVHYSAPTERLRCEMCRLFGEFFAEFADALDAPEGTSFPWAGLVNGYLQAIAVANQREETYDHTIE